MGDNIHQPLGQNRKPGKPVSKTPKRSLTGPFLSGLAICAVLGGAGWIALSGARIPTNEATIVLETPPSGSEAPQVETVTSEPESPGGPETGDLQADASSSLNSLNGQSGAEVSTTLGDNGEEIQKFTPIQRPDNRPVLLTPPGRVGQDPRLAHLPDPAIIQDTPGGPLPVRGPDGERAFDIYARPWSGARGTRIAIIVGGLGLSQTGTQNAINSLPEEVTLAFAANGNSLQRWMQEARRSGHEILLQVPFEPFDYPANDPGAGTLTVAAGPERNLADLHQAMSEITNYTGVTNFMGGRFLADPEALEPIMRDIASRGIMFVDDGTSAQSLTDKFSKTLGIPFAASDLVLDGTDRKSTRLNSSHITRSRMPSSA